MASHILLRSGAIKPLSGDTRLPGPETVNKCPQITSPNFLFVPHPFLLLTTSIFQLSIFVYTLYYLVVWVLSVFGVIPDSNLGTLVLLLLTFHTARNLRTFSSTTLF